MWTGTEWLVMGDTVLCSYFSETKSYIVKANGLIEQWGSHHQSSNTQFQIALYVTMSNTNYNITALSYGLSSGWSYPLYAKKDTLATSSFYLASKSDLSNTDHTWSVKGI